ncbi:radical SAM protein [Cohnella faecalis]|uniref:Radical SAM protein n=1 Tax=Cohnella faecalis TaxID=2315694 RepID=A0A398CS52_9BACL|nr:radical SAM protein [Cohnella faecalis]RIE02201.1 radical SAM protein [Cohnella faecalis]
MNPIRYEPLVPRTLLNAVKAPSMPFDWSINPYRGCQHGCSFCYARSTHSFLGESADDAFRSHIYWKKDASAILRSQLRRMEKGKSGLPSHVAIGTATDPYQQLEGREMLTRGCLETLAEFGVPVSITTRSPLVLRDLDVLRKLPGCSVNVSVHTLDPIVWRTFEPSTPSPKLRLDTVRRLNEAGIAANVFMAPILPYITDDDASTEAIIDGCARSGAQSVMPSFLRLSTPEVKAWFFSTLDRAYPRLTADYGALYWRSSSASDEYKLPVRERIRKQLADYGLSSFEKVPQPKAANTIHAAPPSACSAEAAPVQLTLF